MDAIQTLTVAGLALFAGEGLRRAMPVLARLHLPAAVLGGLAVALGVLLLPKAGLTPPVFDSALKAPLLVAFFTTLGFGASLPLLRAGGRQVVLFLGLATALAAAQGLLGMGIAAALGLPPLFGVLTSTTTLAGGPATALAFAPAFEQAGVSGAEAIGIIAAMGGIVLGGLVGGPVAGAVLREQGYGLAGAAKGTSPGTSQAAMVNGSASQSDLAASPSTPPLSSPLPSSQSSTPAPSSAPGATTQAAMQAILLVLAVMWAGTFVSAGFTAVGITLPAYVGAMLVAAVVRNVADSAGWPLPLPSIETFGSLALPLFMAMALMTLELGKLAGLAQDVRKAVDVETEATDGRGHGGDARLDLLADLLGELLLGVLVALLVALVVADLVGGGAGREALVGEVLDAREGFDLLLDGSLDHGDGLLDHGVAPGGIGHIEFRQMGGSRPARGKF
jgi:ESS family glutamate:Na+ symporter